MSFGWSQSDATRLNKLLAKYQEHLQNKKSGGCGECQSGSTRSPYLNYGDTNRADGRPMLGMALKGGTDGLKAKVHELIKKNKGGKLSGGYRYPLDNKEFYTGYHIPTNQQSRYNNQSSNYKPYNELPDKNNNYREVYKLLGY